MNKPFNIFLCAGNSRRSQMAEGRAKWYGRPLFEIQSAGIETHGKDLLQRFNNKTTEE